MNKSFTQSLCFLSDCHIQLMLNEVFEQTKPFHQLFTCHCKDGLTQIYIRSVIFLAAAQKDTRLDLKHSYAFKKITVSNCKQTNNNLTGNITIPVRRTEIYILGTIIYLHMKGLIVNIFLKPCKFFIPRNLYIYKSYCCFII